MFWVSAVLAFYTFLGYPLLLFVRSRWKARPVRRGELQVPISIVLAVRNEQDALPLKLANLLSLDYPAGLCEIIAVSDGSSDATDAILARAAGARLRVLTLPQPQGKAVALNRGVEAAGGEIVVFTDARQRIEPDAIRHLVNNFADPSVGAVSGELIPDGEGAGRGLGVYWQLEKKVRQAARPPFSGRPPAGRAAAAIRLAATRARSAQGASKLPRWESAGGSAIGATGALYAVRRSLLTPLPAGTILDDLYLPMHVVRQGRRVLFEPRARAHDELADWRHEFRRKVRTLTGNYQLLRLAPWLLTRANPVRLAYLSHKLLRLLVPFALVALLLSAAAIRGLFYRVALGLQCGCYGAALLGRRCRKVFLIGRLAEVSRSFVLLNAAAAVAFFYFVSGKRDVWAR
ncbi:MAG: glycosyltransferase family 2 protein [Terriglobales bacterium]